MKLIVGLGNPGNEYINTRHNIGFVFLENYLAEKNLKFDKSKFDGIYTTSGTGEEKIIFLEPQTFMNLSGDSIKQFMNFFKIDASDVLVIFDDKDIKIGKYKVKNNGSSAGHNGIKSIINQLGTEKFNRIRIGIDNGNIKDTSSFVLANFSVEDKKILDHIKEEIFKEIDFFIQGK